MCLCNWKWLTDNLTTWEISAQVLRCLLHYVERKMLNVARTQTFLNGPSLNIVCNNYMHLMTCFLSSAGTHQQGTAAGGRGASSGSIRCQRCREVCKGEVVRVQDTHFHVKCFTCTGKAGVQGIVGKHERGCTVLSWGMGGCCVKVPQGWGGSGLSCPVFLFWGENKMNGSQ